ncbi:MAG: R3H domain-containing nucleic acid-binding protein [Acidobacteriota bacterium]
MSDLNARVSEFVVAVTNAMGLSLAASTEETPDGVRIDLSGDGGDLLVRRRGEGLNALQQVVAAVFRHEMPEGKRIAVDCLGFRKGKDGELRQMALFLAEKARTTGAPQEIGPLNPYERRIVHMAVAELPDISSESIGDAFSKMVIISPRS